MKTRKQFNDLTRAFLGELDSSKIEDGVLNEVINLSQKKVQTDLMPLLSMKYYVKEDIFYNSGDSIPSDLFPSDDSIVKLMCGTGIKANGYLLPNSQSDIRILITAKNAGALYNYAFVTSDDTVSGVIITPPVNNVTFSIIFDLGAGTINCLDIVNALNGNSTFTSMFIASTTTPREIPTDTMNLYLTTGTNPTAYYQTDEVSIEDFSKISNNTYLTPTATNPKFIRKGSVIEILPNTINYSKITYRYTVADLTADTSTTTIPAIYEELILKQTLTMIYEVLTKNAESQNKQIEYASKVKDYTADYINSKNSILSEKQNLEQKK